MQSGVQPQVAALSVGRSGAGRAHPQGLHLRQRQPPRREALATVMVRELEGGRGGESRFILQPSLSCRQVSTTKKPEHITQISGSLVSISLYLGQIVDSGELPLSYPILGLKGNALN